MNTIWNDTLKTLGYTLDEQGNATIGAPESGEQNHAVPLTLHSIIRISGPDTQKFLQGQLSCNIAEVDRIGSRLGSHCNIKGHMISLFRVMKQSSDTFLLRTDASNADKALATIKKYILFSKAEAQLTDELVGIGVFGPDASDIVGTLFSAVPQETDGASCEDDRVLVRVPGDRFEIWLPLNQAPDLLEKLAQQASLAGTDDWLLQEIRAGLPELYSDTSEAFIPQMTNMQAFEGVSFTKGCYTGQEVVTRLQHRGILKKPMYRACVTSTERPQPGQTLHSAEKENIGQVVIAAPTDTGEYELLAVITKDQAESSDIHLGTLDGPVLRLLDLPYTLDPRLFESKR
ncbi:Folate-dependent protein for Fe/S cluster synthesis/repair in oxidative stress [Marinobacterium lacunae]|uniref:Folate-dependent protein for Fe/S cluster synthesis/repair in oxidative stress n=1 Tax=Marinobacterium lacunae TaxID=1232683 RepID=A0A081G234_9GAMM|nr:folate-binding protein YgfZ [Marinobacterium lacunae]KEA64839.1 Folate-dependent protein for Fe/S cluster synthesis/repair in oxidative stress [Marinobacterium lacunae]